MRLDIYKRAEAEGQFSYLAVPEGKMIPEEAVSPDWQDEERGLDFDGEDSELAVFDIEDPLQQIQAKGYAITSVTRLDPRSSAEPSSGARL